MYTVEPSFANGNGIICASLPRSGTASLAKALEILKIGKVHHGMQEKDLNVCHAWEVVSYCTFPFWRKHARRPPAMSPYDIGHPWTRDQWTRLIGPYRVTTDVYAPFSETLIEKFPEAKVILVERNVDSWTKSFGGMLATYFCGWPGFIMCDVACLLGFRPVAASQAVMQGWVGTASLDEAMTQLPALHEKHHAMVRRTVPKDQLLDFTLDQGWEPLCKFLDVPVPDEPFPYINDMQSLLKTRNMVIKIVVGLAVWKAAKWGGGAAVLMYAWRRWNVQLASIIKRWLMSAP